MHPAEILKARQHRPWPLPDGKWKFYQEWNNALFFHWQLDPEDLEPFVPKNLEIDLFEGKAWISLVAFTMEKIRPRQLPAFGPVSNFDEINIRTYVKHGNKSGVYFLSIEAGTRISSFIPRKLSGLPYRYSGMQRKANSYSSGNALYGDRFQVNYTVNPGLLSKNPIDTWLMERYALFQDQESGLHRFEIHHPEWPAFPLELSTLKIDYPRFNHLLNSKPQLCHYSAGVKVLAWAKEKITAK